MPGGLYQMFSWQDLSVLIDRKSPDLSNLNYKYDNQNLALLKKIKFDFTNINKHLMKEISTKKKFRFLTSNLIFNSDFHAMNNILVRLVLCGHWRFVLQTISIYFDSNQ